MNILELHQRFLRHCAIEENLSLTTVQAMKSALKTFLKRTVAENLADVSVDLLRSFFWEGKEKYQWSTWHYSNNHKYLKKFLNWCVEQGHIKENPVLQIKKPKHPQHLPRRLTYAEAQKALCASFNCKWHYRFERTRNYALIATLLYAGLRANELLNLGVMDMNLEAGNLVVRHGKGGKDRYVPIHYKLTYILKRYFEDRQSAGKKSAYLFTGAKSDKPLNYKGLRQICRKISMESGVQFTPHCLRHTFASIAIEQGVGVVQIKEILGHSNIASTMIYTQMSTEGLKQGLNKVEML
jgi:site-specific recombinase XerD